MTAHGGPYTPTSTDCSALDFGGCCSQPSAHAPGSQELGGMRIASLEFVEGRQEEEGVKARVEVMRGCATAASPRPYALAATPMDYEPRVQQVGRPE